MMTLKDWIQLPFLFIYLVILIFGSGIMYGCDAITFGRLDL